MYRLMDNRSHEESRWDEELLSLELLDLKGLDLDLALTGFDSNEIDKFLLQPDDERANLAPPLPEEPTSRAGDLWLLGPHRVLCGDSTDKQAVARLLDVHSRRAVVYAYRGAYEYIDIDGHARRLVLRLRACSERSGCLRLARVDLHTRGA
jgi:ParB-like chromosome segregation protein Spo0J